MRKINKGFTLIEIMVVIAVIGILAMLVLTALGSGRKQATDATVKSTLNQLATQMELYNIDNGDYGPTFGSNPCPTSADPSVFYSNAQIRTSISNLNATNGNNTKCAAGTPNATGNATSWSIAAPVGTGFQFWCVDSSGQAKISYLDDGGWVARMLSYVTPTTYAAISIPLMHGGNGSVASCP